MCGGGLWQEILGTETAVILDQDDRGTPPMTGSIGRITRLYGGPSQSGLMRDGLENNCWSTVSRARDIKVAASDVY